MCQQSVHKLLSIPFTEEIKIEYKKLFLEGRDLIPYEGLVDSLVSVNWTHCFLEIYRCVENLFPHINNSLKELHSKLEKEGMELDLLDLASVLETKISWRPNDPDSIKNIFENTPDNIGELLLNALQAISFIDENETLHKAFYKLRNATVHFRPALKDPREVESKTWERIVQGSLQVINYRYSNLP